MAAGPTARPSLTGYAVFAAMLSAAGLPIYIHAPKFYVDEYGVGLSALAGVLFGLRLLDVVQDPALGWLAGRLQHARALAVALAVLVLAMCMIGLFSVVPPIAPALWFAAMMTGLFSAFSFLTICVYAEGVGASGRLPSGGHLRLAAWRETGALLGICVAAVAPTALSALDRPFAAFALGFAGLCLVAAWLMRGQWLGTGDRAPASFKPVIADPVARRLLAVALLNAAPVAVSSTLFLFFVESGLEAPGWEGPLLVLFFLSAALAAPLWTRLARRFGIRRILLLAMGIAIASFATVLTLGPGDLGLFALVCLFSGLAIGADFALLPALFATRMEQIAPDAAAGFGLWSFVQKATLALAAVTLLPVLDAVGFVSGGQNDANAVRTLTWLYALVPCVLKSGAIALLSTVRLPDVLVRPQTEPERNSNA